MSLANMPRGINTTDQQFALVDGEALILENVIARPDGGFIAAPGYCGLTETPAFDADNTNPYYILKIYNDVLDAVLCFSVEGSIYKNNDATLVYSGWGKDRPPDCVSALGKDWFAKASNRPLVWDGTTMYPLGISPPTGATATAAAGGTLADGVYKIFVSYSVLVSGSNKLYSVGQSIADVTLGTGNNTVVVTIANSSEARVTNKVVWMTDAGGTVWYYYGASGNNTSPTVTISSASARDVTLVYTVQAASNVVAPNIEFITYCNGRLFGNISNVVYYSLKSVTVSNPYDLERWYTTENYIEYPFAITSMFTMNNDLFLNTAHGLIRQPAGDPTQKFEIVDTFLYFKWRYFDLCNSGMIGLTNDGIRIFNGQSFSPPIDTPIRSDLTAALQADTTYSTMGIVHVRAGIREEYQIAGYVVSIDTIQALSATRYVAAWETRTVLYTSATHNSKGTLIMLSKKALSRNTTLCVENINLKSVTAFASIGDHFDPQGYWNADYRVFVGTNYISDVPIIGRLSRIKSAMKCISTEAINMVERAVVIANHAIASVGSFVYLYLFCEDLNGLSTTEKIQINYQQTTTARTFHVIKVPRTCQGRFVSAMITTNELQRGLQISEILVEGYSETTRATT